MEARKSQLRKTLSSSTDESVKKDYVEKVIATVTGEKDQQIKVNGDTYRHTRKPPLEILQSNS